MRAVAFDELVLKAHAEALEPEKRRVGFTRERLDECRHRTAASGFEHLLGVEFDAVSDARILLTLGVDRGKESRADRGVAAERGHLFKEHDA